MLSIRLSEELETKLSQLSNKTHRSKTFYVIKALEKYLAELEDTYITLDRIMMPSRKFLSSKQVLKALKKQKNNMFKVLWDSQSLDDLKKIDIPDAKKIVDKVENYLSHNPKKLGKQLSPEYKGLYRYRYRDYRIIYQIVEQEITIIVVKVRH